VAQPTASETTVAVAQPSASETTVAVAQSSASETTVAVAQPTASEKPPRAISQRRRPAQERIRQELGKKAPEYIDTLGDETCWSIAGRLVETRGSARQVEIDKTSKALKRYYDNRRKDRPPQD
jgi:hypothetical protein